MYPELTSDQQEFVLKTGAATVFHPAWTEITFSSTNKGKPLIPPHQNAPGTFSAKFLLPDLEDEAQAVTLFA